MRCVLTKTVSFVTLLIFTSNVHGAKILGVFPMPSVSHQAIFQPIWKELSLRGHQVTVVTPSPLKDPQLTNLTEIDVSFAFAYLAQLNFISDLTRVQSIFHRNLVLLDSLTKVVQREIECAEVQALLNGGEQFDLVLLQVQFITTLVYGFAVPFEAPIVGISSLGVFMHTHDALGNPTHPLVTPDPSLNFERDPSFFDKVQSLLFNIWYRLLYYGYALPKSDKVARKYFGNDMPYLGDIEKIQVYF